MFKKSILLRFFIALFFCSPIAVYSQSCPFSDFKKMYYENDSTMYPNNFVDAINVTSDSAYFIGGSQIAKIDVNGNRLWNGSQNNSFLGSDAIPYFAPDGKYYVILSNFTLIHIDKNESIVWTKYLLDTNCYCNPIVNHITQTSDGGFIITGSKTILDTTYYRDRIFVVKTNSLGDTIWTKTLAASGADNKGYYSQETADGGYLVVANIKTSGIIQDKYRVGIIKLNANGQEQWYKIESKPIYYGAKIKGMKTNDGDCAIVASVDSVLVSTYFMKINGNGDAVVDTAYSNRKFNGGLMQLANGDYLLGMEDSLSEISASTKAILWSKAFIGSVGENIPVNSIKPLCDKAVVIAGNSGVYQYTVNCCGSDDYYYNFKSYLFKVDSTYKDVAILGVMEHTLVSSNNIIITPNPFSFQTTIAVEKEVKNATLNITNVIGQNVSSIQFSGNKIILEKAELKPGIYFVQLFDKNNNIQLTRKIVIQ